MLNASGQFTTSEYDARLEGFFIKDAPIGVSNHYYIFPFDCYFNGIAIASTVSGVGSNVNLTTEYQAAPDVWLRYKKFASTWNLFPNYVCKTILFPTKPKEGIRINIKIVNNELTPIDLGVNLFQFTPIASVNPLLGEQGEDW